VIVKNTPRCVCVSDGHSAHRVEFLPAASVSISRSRLSFSDDGAAGGGELGVADDDDDDDDDGASDGASAPFVLRSDDDDGACWVSDDDDDDSAPAQPATKTVTANRGRIIDQRRYQRSRNLKLATGVSLLSPMPMN
jgi:hypothetical protein